MVYECACGFEAGTAVAMHKHLSAAASSDAGHQHFLKSSFGLPNRNAPHQQQQQAAPTGRGSSGNGGRAAAAVSGSSTPNSLYGFTPVSPVGGGDDVITQAWEAVEQFYSSPNSAAAGAAAAQAQHSSRQQQQQRHYPAVPGTAAGAFDAPSSSSRSPQRQSAQSGQQDAAAVQFAAGLSLHAAVPASRKQQQQQHAGTAGPVPVSSHGAGAADRSSRERPVQQEEQGWGEQLGAGVQGALGVQLMAGSNGLMAAMGGWVVNQAISAAVAPAAEGPDHAGGHYGGEGASAAAGAGLGSGSSSWWKRFSSRALEPAVNSPGSPPDASAAAEQGGKKGIKGSIKAAAKRHGLRRKASVAAANAATGRSARSSEHDEGEFAVGAGLDGSFSDSPRSDGSTEYSQLLSQMDSELRGAAAAGAAAAVASPARGARQAGNLRLSGTADAAGGIDSYAEVDLNEDDAHMLSQSSDEEGAPGGSRRVTGSAGSSWLAVAGLVPRTSSGAVARAASSSGGGGYMLVDHDGTGPSLAHRARVLRGLLLWRSPGASAKALGLGIYIIMLLSNIPRALHYMQVTTVLPGVALLYLTYNMAKPWTIRLYCSFISPASDAAHLQARLGSAEEYAARAVVWFAAKAAVEAGSWSLALLALAHRALRAHRFTTSCWTFVALWLLLLVSELRVINQMLLAMIAYAGLFCVPWLYKQFRTVIDKVVYDTVHFVTLLVVNAERWAYAVAALAAALTWQLLEPSNAATGASLVVRCTASGVAGLSVLLWRVLVAE